MINFNKLFILSTSIIFMVDGVPRGYPMGIHSLGWTENIVNALTENLGEAVS